MLGLEAISTHTLEVKSSRSKQRTHSAPVGSQADQNMGRANCELFQLVGLTYRTLDRLSGSSCERPMLIWVRSGARDAVFEERTHYTHVNAMIQHQSRGTTSLTQQPQEEMLRQNMRVIQSHRLSVSQLHKLPGLIIESRRHHFPKSCSGC